MVRSNPIPPEAPEPPGTRDRLIAAMADALQRRGLHAVGLAELLTQAQAPKGVLYHHFPGGKNELAAVAIAAVSARVTGGLDQLAQDPRGLIQGLRAWLGAAQRGLIQSGFERGCPLATVALESSAQDQAIRAALAQGFADIRDKLATLLQTAGLQPPRAVQFAALIVSAYEGALLQARVANNPEAMSATVELLLSMVEREITAKGSTP
jgi:TetR/AcrR family transcriptional regulator, lmrAB and yxaGH operons repressor